MKWRMLRLAIAILTFALGVAAAELFFRHNAPSLNHSSTREFKALITSQVPSSFPGLSVKTQVMGKLLFFPPGIFSTNDESDQFRAAWYSKHLVAMNEPRLYFSENSDEESYRFTWLRSFNHPVAVRIWSRGGAHFIGVKELDGAGGYEPGKLIVNRVRPITRNQWDEFLTLLEQGCYWKLQTKDDKRGLDGASWILEGVKEGRYHIVDRWSPESGSYYDLCFYLLKLSGLGFDASSIDIY